MFKIGVSSLAISIFSTASLAEEPNNLGVPTADMYDMNLTAEQGACLEGLNMVRTPMNAVSEYDGETPLTEDEIRELQKTGAILIAKFCPNMV